MTRRSIIRVRLLLASLLFILLLAGAGLVNLVFPAISGFGAKNLCSAHFLQHRQAEEVLREDLSEFPISLGHFEVQDQSASGSVFGFAFKKAFYRKGLGCTLVSSTSEANLRQQTLVKPKVPDINQDQLYWPDGNKLKDTVYPELDAKKLWTVINSLFHELNTAGRACKTRSVLVLYKGQIVGEQYASGFNRNTLMPAWSMTKSFTSALCGVLVKQQKLQVDCTLLRKEWRDTLRSIRVKDLLQQCSGLDFSEIYSRPSSVTRMLYQEDDMGAYASSLPLKEKPGSVFEYSSGNSNILGAYLRKLIGPEDYAAFPYDQLFYQIKAYSVVLEPDASGTYNASSYAFASTRDFARFAMLYYNVGKWNGEQILEEGWIRESLRPAPSDPLGNYAYQFWLNGWSPEHPGQRSFPDVPSDMFYADGYGGQNIYIIPSRHLIVIRLGLHTIAENTFLKEVLACFRRDQKTDTIK
ncbi:MAG TPA: serine hydrolase [Bacteroidia bacterium]|nr:serine hydrolase [Bacteroidia bacterium]